MSSSSTETAPGGAARPTLTIGQEPLGLEGFAQLATGLALPQLSPEAAQRMEAAHGLVQRRLMDGQKIYGVTTGYGDSVRNAIPPASSAALSLNLLRFHGCGTGRVLQPVEAAAVLVARLCSLARGYSGVRPAVAERLCELLRRRILPAIFAEGSVGASGDLTPLSYVAALLVGEREALTESGEMRPAIEALAEHGLEPLTLGPKEALALMNGTSVATALAILAFGRARRLARLTARITALASRTIGGNPEHFSAILHGAKGHPGQLRAAQWIRQELAQLPGKPAPCRLQDRYSIRCAPHVLGVLVDALDWFEGVLVTELNGVSDNPIVDIDHEVILHGGNFYGSHVGFAMDTLKGAVANVADLLDRQLVVLCLPQESNGLPENLVGAEGPEIHTHHGFKAMSISASALTAEALKLTIPASVFSRSTESHNQDKVPMATIASRDALRVVELTERVAAICTLAVCQAAELRARGEGQPGPSSLGALHGAVRQHVPFVRGDRRMDRDIQTVVELIQSGVITGEAREPEPADSGSGPETQPSGGVRR